MVNPGIYIVSILLTIVIIVSISLFIVATIKANEDLNEQTNTGQFKRPCKEIVKYSKLYNITKEDYKQDDTYIIKSLQSKTTRSFSYQVSPVPVTPNAACVGFCSTAIKRDDGKIECSGESINGITRQELFDSCIQVTQPSDCTGAQPIAVKGTQLYYLKQPIQSSQS